jgi:hypothetical protein
MEMTLHPRAEPRPALKYRLLPDEFDILEGNAAVYYLKALGFLEQTWPQNELNRVHKEAAELAQQDGKEYDEVPPHVWLTTAPHDLLEHHDTPNLFWALAAMPKPLVDVRRSLAVEREFLYLQLKVLREVDETPRPCGYWEDFLDRLLPQIGDLGGDLDGPSFEDDPQLARKALVEHVTAVYPGAKEYLIEQCKLSPRQVEAYPTTQVVFLAMVRFYDRWRDELSKWAHLPLWQVLANSNHNRTPDAMRAELNRYGWCSALATKKLPSVYARAAEGRCGQMIALLQTVEAIRMYGAAHDGRLPPSLDELSVPPGIEPFTGKPVDYEFYRTHAVLNGHALPGKRHRLVLRMAERSE